MKTESKAMIKMKALFIAGTLFTMPMATLAGQQIITLKVDGISCAGCLYQVKRALTRVEGVISARVTPAREAVVTFDDAVTNFEALIQATADAGFPSELKT